MSLLLGEHGITSALIGGWAVAARGYDRATVDIDLAVSTTLASLRTLARVFEGRGYSVSLNEPDAGDPLGGTVVVSSVGSDPVHVVNYQNSLNALGALGQRIAEAAIAEAEDWAELGLPVVRLAHLLLLKLYAWDGTSSDKAANDIRNLIRENPSFDYVGFDLVCDRHGYGNNWRRFKTIVFPAGS